MCHVGNGVQQLECKADPLQWGVSPLLLNILKRVSRASWQVGRAWLLVVGLVGNTSQLAMHKMRTEGIVNGSLCLI